MLLVFLAVLVTGACLLCDRDREKKLADDESALAKLEKERAAKQTEKREVFLFYVFRAFFVLCNYFCFFFIFFICDLFLYGAHIFE